MQSRKFVHKEYVVRFDIKGKWAEILRCKVLADEKKWREMVAGIFEGKGTPADTDLKF
jgi:hypothetical protein